MPGPVVVRVCGAGQGSTVTGAAVFLLELVSKCLLGTTAWSSPAFSAFDRRAGSSAPRTLAAGSSGRTAARIAARSSADCYGMDDSARECPRDDESRGHCDPLL